MTKRPRQPDEVDFAMMEPSIAARVGWARNGELSALVALADPREVFRWLLVAGDFGHDADDLIGDLEEHEDLFRYDDDGYERAMIRWALALDYLRGSGGLSCDVACARTHLRAFLFCDAFSSLEEVEASFFRETRPTLSAEACAVLDQLVESYPFEAVKRRAERLGQLRQIQAGGADIPVVILAGEVARLREEVEVLATHVLPPNTSVSEQDVSDEA